MNRKEFLKTGGLIALGLSGCSNTTDVFKRLPKLKNLGKRYDLNQIREGIYSHNVNSKGLQIYSNSLFDQSYAAVDHQWMINYLEWWDVFKWQLGLDWTPEMFDCDNFAEVFKVLANLAAIRACYDTGAQILVGAIVVKQDKPWADVPTIGYHALNFFVSERGAFVVEPQNNTIVKIEEYPNKDYIVHVNI